MEGEKDPWAMETMEVVVVVGVDTPVEVAAVKDSSELEMEVS